MRLYFLILLLALSSSGFSQKKAKKSKETASTETVKHSFTIGETDFLYDGKPIVIKSGEIHLNRVPKEYWRHRMQMLKAMGCNGVGTYLFWNAIETEPDKFDFSGQNDIVEFCKIAQEEGLLVTLRPGPYVCAEWEMGGFPWWLLKRKDLKVRTHDTYFIERSTKYLEKVAKVVNSLQVTKGGPIVMVQVENELGYFSKDRTYLVKMHDIYKKAGFEVPLYTCDQGATIKNTASENIFSVVNFGSNPEQNFKYLREMRPKGPLMCGEYYPGWFDVWGSKHHTGTIEKLEKEIGYMLSNNASFSLYMAHGGTTFGFWAGANGMPYQPTISDYDYDAPITEAGWETPKFFAMRNLLLKYMPKGTKLPDVPKRNPVIAIPEFAINEVAPIMENLGKDPIFDYKPRNMEEYNQGFGCVVYRTKIPAGEACRLITKELRDYGVVMLDGKKVGTIDLTKKQNFCNLPARSSEMTLDIFVEPMGRINFGEHILNKKGITESVEIVTDKDSKELVKWEVYLLPMGDYTPKNLNYKKDTTSLPAFYRGTFTLDKVGDSFLDVSTWGKGMVWVNGHCLGRYWGIGPSQTMYLPAPWLKKGVNEVVVLDVKGATKRVLSGHTEPILDKLNIPVPEKNRKPNQNLDLSKTTPVATGTFPAGTEWQMPRFAAIKGRYLCLEALDSHDESSYTTVAELYALDTKGNELPRDKWKVVYADSEEVMSDDGKATNVFDRQFTCFWHTEWDAKKPKHPHQIVIDLGEVQNVAGIKYLPRQDKETGRIKNYRVYISETLFQGL